eukprot:2923813-Alexandrium_andersonii.AAC.1
MSASLVGSEMCIRDRVSWRCRRVRPGRPRNSGRCCKARPGRLWGSWHSPVSYTHLTLPTICSV